MRMSAGEAGKGCMTAGIKRRGGRYVMVTSTQPFAIERALKLVSGPSSNDNVA